MVCRSLSSFFWPSQAEFAEQENPNSENAPSMAWISGVAIATIALTAWNIMERRPWIAAAVGLGGICLEVALMRLFPSQVEVEEEEIIAPISSPMATKSCETIEGLESVIENLEKCYPIQTIDPIQIKNKQTGGMMGQACGDAIGLYTEFTTREEAQEMMGGKPIEFGPDYPKEFKDGYNWSHISRFIKNGWTDDTDQALALLRALYLYLNVKEIGVESSPFETLFARELRMWKRFGLKTEEPFIGRSNPYCMGLGALVNAVLKEPSFLKNPKKAAEHVWAKDRDLPIQNRPAANGAIMRTAPIALIFYRSLNDVIFYTIKACQVTHVDPRCTASCVALNLAIALSLRGYDCDAIFQAAEEGGLAVLRHELDLAAEKKLLCDKEIEEIDALYETLAEDFKTHLHGDWETLDLDEGWKDKEKINKIGYTFKCMGAAFYALRLASEELEEEEEEKVNIFRTVIEMIAGEGGDADTNGAAAGALLGAYLGFQDRFPINWTSQLADTPIMEQAIQHVEELSLKHQSHLKSLGKKE